MNPREFQLATHLLSFSFPMKIQTSVSDGFGGCKELASGSKRGQIPATQSVVPGPVAMASPGS